MKLLHFSLFLFLSVSTYSQGFCDYGDYNFIFNTIKGINKSSFNKIELKVKEKTIYVENYNEKGDLINSNYNETINVGEGIRMVSIDNPCYTEVFIEQQTKEYKYEYSLDSLIEKVNVYSNKNLEDSNTYFYDSITNTLKKIKGEFLDIFHEYYKNGLLKKIDRNGKVFDFFWSNNRMLKKIIVTPTDYSYDEYIHFEYNSDNTIHSITTQYFDRATKKKSSEYVKDFCYADNKLKRITSTEVNIKDNQKEKSGSRFYVFDYSKKGVLTINALNENKQYIKHYECYYF